jgi:hypothetical protein
MSIRTEAGKRLLEARGRSLKAEERVAAIEAEARSAALAEVRREVEGLPRLDIGGLGEDDQWEPHIVVDLYRLWALLERLAAK